MAFELKQGLFELANASQLNLWDSTGVYDVATNPTGYGSPNIATTDVTQATFAFKFDTINVTMLLDLRITTGTVTQVLFTNALGVIEDLTDVMGDYGIANFPAFQYSPITLPPILFNAGISSFGDQYVNILYTITNGVDVYTSDVNWLMNANACCCLAKAWRNDSEHNCQDRKAIPLQNSMNALNAQNAVGDIVAARKTLERIQKLCCGCGCGGGC
jgi:hypothetical protein